MLMISEVYPLLTDVLKTSGPADPVCTWANRRPVKDFRTTWSTMRESANIHLLLHDFVARRLGI
jgi:hypothetical protein